MKNQPKQIRVDRSRFSKSDFILNLNFSDPRHPLNERHMVIKKHDTESN